MALKAGLNFKKPKEVVMEKTVESLKTIGRVLLPKTSTTLGNTKDALYDLTEGLKMSHFSNIQYENTMKRSGIRRRIGILYDTAARNFRQGSADFENFGDDLDSILDGGFEEDENGELQSVEPDEQTTAVVKTTKATIASIEKMTDIVSNITLETGKASSEKIVRATISSLNVVNNSLLGVNKRLDLINDNLVALVKFNNDNVRVTNQRLNEYMDKSLVVLNHINNSYSNLIPKSKETSNPMLELFMNGFDTKAYGNLVKNQFKNSDLGMFLEMGGMMKGLKDIDGLMNGALSSGIKQMVTDTVLGMFIPKKTKQALSRFDNIGEDLIKNILLQVGDMASSDNILKSIFGQIFGIRANKLDKINLGLFNKGAVPWDGVARQTLVEVIPSLLASIDAGINKKEKSFYDMKTGTFKTTSKVRGQLHKEIDDAISMSMYDTKSKAKEIASKSGMDPELVKVLQNTLDKAVKTAVTSPSGFDRRQMQRNIAAVLRKFNVDEKDIEDFILRFNSEYLDAKRSINDVTNRINTNNPDAMIYRYLMNEGEFDITKIINDYSLFSGEKKKNEPSENIKKMRELQEGVQRGVKNKVTRITSTGKIGRVDDRVSGKINALADAIISPILYGVRRDISPSNPPPAPGDDSSSNGGSEPPSGPGPGPTLGEARLNQQTNQIIKNIRSKLQSGDDIQIPQSRGGKDISPEAEAASQAKVQTSILASLFNGLFGKSGPYNQRKVRGEKSKRLFDIIKEKLFGKKNEEGSYEGGPLSGISNAFEAFKKKFKAAMKGGEYTDADGNVRSVDESDSTLGKLKSGIASGADMVGATLNFDTRKIREYLGVPPKKMGPKPDTKRQLKITRPTIRGRTSHRITPKMVANAEASSDEPAQQQRAVVQIGLNATADAMNGVVESIDKAKENVEAASGAKVAKRNIFKEINDKISPSKLTKMGLGAVIGGAIPFLANHKMGILGAFLPGGVIGGALLGMGVATLKGSENFNKVLFGEKGEDGNRHGGVVSQSLQDKFKSIVPKLVTGGLIGSIFGRGLIGAATRLPGAGILVNAVMPGGPIGGALLGIGATLLFNSKTFNETLFGADKAGEPKTKAGKIIKDLKDKFVKNKDVLKSGAIGLLKGASIGAMASRMGVLGATLGPAGVVGGAIIGLGINIAKESDKVHDVLFGTRDEKGERRKDGIFSRLESFLTNEVLNPVAVWAKGYATEMAIHFRKAVLRPFRQVVGPIVDGFKNIKETVQQGFQNFFDKITDGALSLLKKPFEWAGKKIGGLIRGGASILGKGITGASKALITTAGLPLRAISALMLPSRAKTTGKFLKDYIGGAASAFSERRAQNAQRAVAEGDLSLGSRLRGIGTDFAQTIGGRALGAIKGTDQYFKDKEAWGTQHGIGNMMGWFTNRQTKRAEDEDAKKRRAGVKQEKKQQRLISKFARKDSFVADRELTDEEYKSRIEQLEKLGVDISQFSGQSDLMEFIHSPNKFKERKAKENAQKVKEEQEKKESQERYDEERADREDQKGWRASVLSTLFSLEGATTKFFGGNSKKKIAARIGNSAAKSSQSSVSSASSIDGSDVTNFSEIGNNITNAQKEYDNEKQEKERERNETEKAKALGNKEPDDPVAAGIQQLSDKIGELKNNFGIDQKEDKKEGFWSKLSNLFSGNFGKILGGGALAAAIVTALSNDKVKEFVKNGIGSIGDFLLQGIRGIGDTLKNAIAETSGDTDEDKSRTLADGTVIENPNVKNNLMRIPINLIKRGMLKKDLINLAKRVPANILGAAGHGLGNLAERAGQRGMSNAADIASTLSRGAANTSEALIENIDNAYKVRGAVVNGLTSGAKAIGRAAKNTATKAIDTIKDSDLIKNLLTMIQSGINKLKDSKAMKKLMSSEMISKVISKLDDMIKKLLTGSGRIFSKFKARITDAMAQMSARMTGMIPFLGIAITAGFAVYDAYTGYANAGRLFEVSEKDVTPTMRLVSSIIQILLGLLKFGPIIEILEEMSAELFNFPFLKYLANGLHYLFTLSTNEHEALKMAQNEFAEEVDKYNEENGTNLSNRAYVDGQKQIRKEERERQKEAQKQKQKEFDNLLKERYQLARENGYTPSTKVIPNQGEYTVDVEDDTQQTFSEGVGYGRGGFRQGDSRWKNLSLGKLPNGRNATMDRAGCGPTALANAAQALGKNANPAQIARIAKAQGHVAAGGAATSLFDSGARSIGLRSRRISSQEDIVNSLRSGKPVVLSGKNAGYGPYTKAGHVVTATGIDKNGKINVDDPMRGRSKYSMGDLTKGLRYGWSMNAGYGSEDEVGENHSKVKLENGAVYYSQRDPKWRDHRFAPSLNSSWTLGNVGCVVTSSSMATSSLSKTDWNPMLFSKHFADPAYRAVRDLDTAGMLQRAAAANDLKYIGRVYKGDDVQGHLQSGHPAILQGTPGGNDNPFGTSTNWDNHAILATGVDKNGNIRINDPWAGPKIVSNPQLLFSRMSSADIMSKSDGSGIDPTLNEKSAANFKIPAGLPSNDMVNGFSSPIKSAGIPKLSKNTPIDGSVSEGSPEEDNLFNKFTSFLGKLGKVANNVINAILGGKPYKSIYDTSDPNALTDASAGGVDSNGANATNNSTGLSAITNTDAKTIGEQPSKYAEEIGYDTDFSLRYQDRLNKSLKQYAPATIQDINSYIDRMVNKAERPEDSILPGTGEYFLEASKRTGIDPRYLVAHAGVESAWGRSKITKERGNFFGIEAYNNIESQSAKSFSSASDPREKAKEGIIKGAEWIDQNFISGPYQQDTLAKMIGVPGHVYAAYNDKTPNYHWANTIAGFMDNAGYGELGAGGQTFSGNRMIGRATDGTNRRLSRNMNVARMHGLQTVDQNLPVKVDNSGVESRLDRLITIVQSGFTSVNRGDSDIAGYGGGDGAMTTTGNVQPRHSDGTSKMTQVKVTNKPNQELGTDRLREIHRAIARS